MRKKTPGIFDQIHNHVKLLNESKIFAGLMIIIINIASKFVTFKFSKSMESYLKFTFSRDILVFAITWMGTRDVYIALSFTLLFVFIADYLMNENSMFCCLPASFIDKHVSMLEGFNENLSKEEIEKYKKIMEIVKESDDKI
jgi:hypothetical protein|uniref:Uncharacterized protein n=1 Tax=viral metagenome TaxID=1070528 RepID=A0A6C0DY71_9ZZZZ